MARELWFTGPGCVEVRDAPAPSEPVARGQIEARALASGVSQGTELLLYTGEGTTPFDPSLDAPGAPTYPRRYGYAWVGEVTAGELPVGRRVFALAPHGDVHRLAIERVRVLPDAIPPWRAVLAANLETALTAVWDSGATLGDRAVVYGAGVVGLLVTRLLVRAGAADVIVVEPSPKRRAAALALGATRAVAPGAEAPGAEAPGDMPTAERPSAEAQLADVVFELTGRPEALTSCLRACAMEGRVIVVSNYGGRRAPVALGDVFHRRRLQIVSSQVSSIPAARRPRWDLERRFAVVAALLRDEALDALLEPAVPFSRAGEVYATLDDRLQVVFDYGG